MNLKTLLTVGMMTLAAGLLPAGAEAALVAAPAPAVPMNAAAFAEGSSVQVAPVVVVRNRNRRHYRRGYYGNRRHYRQNRRVIIRRN